MFDFDNDGDSDLEDLIEADIEYGLFEKVQIKTLINLQKSQKKNRNLFKN